MKIAVGTYVPSIARPAGSDGMQMFNPLAAAENELAKSYWREHKIIAADIERSFAVIAPSQDNYSAYGAQFEKIIYQACVGVESLFNKILSDNGMGSRDTGMKTFVKLKPWLHVEEYTLEVVYYPWLPDVHPFKDWDIAQPSRSLPWFNAYNSLKHDRQLEPKFSVVGECHYRRRGPLCDSICRVRRSNVSRLRE